MNLKLKSLVVAIAFGSSVTTATASSVITNVTASGPGLGSFSLNSIGSIGLIDFSSTFGSVNPITYTFTVGHSETGFSSYHVVEDIINGTSAPFTGLHLQIVEPESAPANGVVWGFLT